MPRRYVARNPPAMPKAPQRGIRLSLDFPNVEAMLQFRDTLNSNGDHDIGGSLSCYKLDYFDIQEMPIGNHYLLSPKTDELRTELTREIVTLQTTNYEQRKRD